MWKQFNDTYSVSNLGEVKNIKTNKTLKGQLNSKGYKRVFISKQRYFIHRLVSTLFIPNINNCLQVNHIDGDKLNNTVSNLEWCNNQYNNLHSFANGRISGRTKICKESILLILKYLNTKEYKVKELAKMYNVSIPTIYAIKQGLNMKRFL